MENFPANILRPKSKEKKREIVFSNLNLNQHKLILTIKQYT